MMLKKNNFLHYQRRYNKKLSQLLLKSLRDARPIYHPDGGKSATGWPPYRRIVCGGSKRIGRPEGRTALPLLSVFIRPKIT